MSSRELRPDAKGTPLAEGAFRWTPTPLLSHLLRLLLGVGLGIGGYALVGRGKLGLPSKLSQSG
jgi:hypothetical protein